MTVKKIIYYLSIFMLMFSNCVPPEKLTVLISMMDSQEAYFENSVVPPFANEMKINVDVKHYNIDSIYEVLEQKDTSVGIIKVPFEKAYGLIESGKILALETFLSQDQIKSYEDIYMLTFLTEKNGKHYYVPRKFETRLMVYRKSRVADAVALWRNKKEQLSMDLKKLNNFGLPSNYLLEDDPNEWDYYDIFVVGWIWAHTMYNGTTVPRVAHRGKAYSGTSHRIIDRVFQCGGDSTTVVNMEGDAVIDAFQWEAIYAAGGIYNSRMWRDRWSGSGVWKGFKSGDVFLSFMTQLDCFFIHGTGQDGLDGYLDNPEDMGVAVMPKGCSFELGSDGIPKRQGTRSITTGGWWWGISAKTRDPEMAYKLALHITSLENQIQGCSRFGMIPVRKDVLGDMNMLFGGDWISDIYDISFKQLMLNEYTMIPSNSHFQEIGEIYLDAWFDIVVDKNWAENGKVPNFSYIKTLIEKNYSNRVKQF